MAQSIKRLVKQHVKTKLRHALENFGIDKYSFPGLNGLDKRVLEYLPKKPGFFIETGANNGYSQSNTYFLERFRGWTGVLIEPIPELYQECRKERKRSHVFNCALVANDYSHSHIEIHHLNLMSFVYGSKGDKEYEAIEKGKICAPGLQGELIKVPARTLTSILDEIFVDEIDFFSLDVEGYELEVLKGLDLFKYRPRFLLVEANDRTNVIEHLKPMYEIEKEFNERDILFKLSIGK